MSKVRGFRVGKRFIQLSRWILRKIQIRTPLGYHRLSDRDVSRSPVTKLLKWGRKLKCRLRVKSKSGQTQLESRSDPAVPKGHLAVYVGQKDSDGEVHRVLIPVIYFNHPLFGELLKEAEQEFGFHHEGGITIPCRFTEFERVKTRIASGSRPITRSKKLAWL